MGAKERIPVLYVEMQRSLTKVFENERLVDQLYEVYRRQQREHLGLHANAKLPSEHASIASTNAEKDNRFVTADWKVRYHMQRVVMLAAAYGVEADFLANGYQESANVRPTNFA